VWAHRSDCHSRDRRPIHLSICKWSLSNQWLLRPRGDSPPEGIAADEFDRSEYGTEGSDWGGQRSNSGSSFESTIDLRNRKRHRNSWRGVFDASLGPDVDLALHSSSFTRRTGPFVELLALSVVAKYESSLQSIGSACGTSLAVRLRGAIGSVGATGSIGSPTVSKRLTGRRPRWGARSSECF